MNSISVKGAGEKVDVDILRQNKRITLDITIGELEAELTLNTKASVERLNDATSTLGIAASDLSSRKKEQFAGLVPAGQPKTSSSTFERRTKPVAT